MSDASLGSALRGAVDLSSLRNRPAAPQGHAPDPQNAVGSAPDVVMEITDQSFSQVLELSRQVPVVVDLWATWCEPCTQLSPIIEKVARELQGRVVLATVDVDQNPQIQQAFQAQSIPLVVALLGGRPVPLFTGAVPEQQVREVFAQLLDVAAQQGVTGTINVGEENGEEPAEEPPLPPLHQEAFDAIQRGDNAAAIAAYEKALAENPRDEQASAGLAQVRLLQRIDGADLHAARRAAAEAPADIDAQMLVADLDIAGGHVDDAFARLLDVFEAAAGDDRGHVKDRLIALFGLIGASDPRVIAARTRLTNLLF
ncbi:MAG TPA: tetratricopeptide repeat protein [Candidatus Microbacterium stercoravium]|uniref:Tetratricopeptide repeat protein n=1 Tax=Candidatus Microbacterium stercoravium TaxID=2838697 RepID=A0A9D2KI86_9MICO|nr:tetratricopeptide repeat protein [Candidatus Microbacterium stercoravium]